MPLRRLFGRPGPARIVAYRSCGTRRMMPLMGRVLEDPNRPPPETPSNLWTLREELGRLLSPGLPGARVELEVDGVRHLAVTGDGGFFETWIERDEPLAEGEMWHRVEAVLVDPDGGVDPDRGQGRERATLEVLAPPPTARLAVVSDLDDTLLETGVARKARMFWTMFATDAADKEAFPGAAALYKALHGGRGGADLNPVVYVSRGPWSLYEALDRFFRIHRIPVGPVLYLRDVGMTWRHPLPKLGRDHKLSVIRGLLDLYSHLPFLLIGDSGQHDPEVYATITREQPERVAAAYIRNVSRGKRREREVRALAAELRAAGASMVVADTTVAMAEHAAQMGWISKEGLEDVRAEATTPVLR